MVKLLKHDIRQSFDMNKAVLALFLCVTILCVVMFWTEWQVIKQWVDENVTFSLGDVLWYLHKGTDFVPSAESATLYQLPIVWIFQMVLLHQLTGYYPVRDWQKCGIQTILRSGSRKKWMAAKIVWVFLVNILFVILQIIILGILTILLGGELSLLPTKIAVGLGGWSLAYYPVTILRAAMLLILMPWLVQTALCISQLALMFVVGPFWAFIGVVAYEVAATCLPSGLLMANYSMCMREFGITPFYDGAMERIAGILFSSAWIVVFSLIALMIIQKKDILGRGETE